MLRQSRTKKKPGNRISIIIWKGNKTMKKIDVEHAVSFTGHRPERLDMPEAEVQEWLEIQIRKAIDDGYTDFISGM